VDGGKFVPVAAGEEIVDLLAKQGRVDTSIAGKVGLDLAQSLAKLALSARRVATLMVIEADGDVDQGLEEQTLRAAAGDPELLQDFVALEEPAAIEQGDAVPECFFVHARIIL
jgi:hypothetical protein